MSFNQIIKGAKRAICIVFWIEVFLVTVILLNGTQGIENQILIICLAVFMYYISIFWRNNKFVFGFMTVSVILFVIILALSNSSKSKYKI